jgi:hypothetical protein
LAIKRIEPGALPKKTITSISIAKETILYFICFLLVLLFEQFCNIDEYFFQTKASYTVFLLTVHTGYVNIDGIRY